MAIQMEQMMAVRTVMSREPNYREQLRDLAVEIAAKEEGWMPYSKTMEVCYITFANVSNSPLDIAKRLKICQRLTNLWNI